MNKAARLVILSACAWGILLATIDLDGRNIAQWLALMAVALAVREVRP